MTREQILKVGLAVLLGNMAGRSAALGILARRIQI